MQNAGTPNGQQHARMVKGESPFHPPPETPQQGRSVHPRGHRNTFKIYLRTRPLRLLLALRLTEIRA